jgi:hypothetical protein
VRTAGTARLGASAQSLVNDGLDGARAPAAFGTATEASIELLGIPGEVFCPTDRSADVVVGEDVTGTNNHENGRSISAAGPEILKATARCKRKNRLLKLFQTEALKL